MSWWLLVALAQAGLWEEVKSQRNDAGAVLTSRALSEPLARVAAGCAGVAALSVGVPTGAAVMVRVSSQAASTARARCTSSAVGPEGVAKRRPRDQLPVWLTGRPAVWPSVDSRIGRTNQA